MVAFHDEWGNCESSVLITLRVLNQLKESTRAISPLSNFNDSLQFLHTFHGRLRFLNNAVVQGFGEAAGDTEVLSFANSTDR